MYKNFKSIKKTKEKKSMSKKKESCVEARLKEDHHQQENQHQRLGNNLEGKEPSSMKDKIKKTTASLEKYSKKITDFFSTSKCREKKIKFFYMFYFLHRF